MGNLFPFNLAGFETTAGNLLFSISFIAAFPEYQEWLIEEINVYYHPGKTNAYDETYPKLVRCLAMMHETLRHKSPAPVMLREPSAPTLIPTSATTSMTVTPGAWVSGHFYGVHLSPHWGEYVEEFNPKRFITVNKDGKESLAAPPGDAVFMGWVFGQRMCAGKKFSQVEFVGVVAQLLSTYRVEMVKESPSETEEEARTRMLGVLAEKYFVIGAQLKRPEDVSLRLVPRNRQ